MVIEERKEEERKKWREKKKSIMDKGYQGRAFDLSLSRRLDIVNPVKIRLLCLNVIF